MDSDPYADVRYIVGNLRLLDDALPTAEEAGKAILDVLESCPPTDEEIALWEWRLSPEGTQWAERERMRILRRR